MEDVVDDVTSGPVMYYPVFGVDSMRFANGADFMEKLKCIPDFAGQEVRVQVLPATKAERFAIKFIGNISVLVTRAQLYDLMQVSGRLDVGKPLPASQLKSVMPSHVVVTGGTAQERMTLLDELFRQGVPKVEFLGMALQSAEEVAPAPPSVSPELRQFLEMQLCDLALSPRTFNALTLDNIVTGRDVVLKTEAELLRIPNFGRKSLNEIREMLAVYGAHVGMDLSALEGA